MSLSSVYWYPVVVVVSNEAKEAANLPVRVVAVDDRVARTTSFTHIQEANHCAWHVYCDGITHGIMTALDRFTEHVQTHLTMLLIAILLPFVLINIFLDGYFLGISWGCFVQLMNALKAEGGIIVDVTAATAPVASVEMIEDRRTRKIKKQ
jgi:uncharacterized membrane protein YwzB